MTDPGDRLLHPQRAVGFEVEQRHLAVRLNAIDLGAQRSRPCTPRKVDVLEKLPVVDEALELLGRDEPVLASVLLAGPLLARGRGDGKLDLGHSFEQDLLERAFAGA